MISYDTENLHQMAQQSRIDLWQSRMWIKLIIILNLLTFKLKMVI